VRRLLDEIPEDATRERIERGLKDVAEGRVVSEEDGT
jgi:predicted transcriptional regulator